MTREEALKILHEKMQNKNLRKHCYAVEAVMRALAEKMNEDPEIWGIAGLIHDADYEITKDTAKKDHTLKAIKWLEDAGANKDIIDAVAAHAWKYVESAPEPKTKMQWALYTCDELTGLITACALVKPDKKLSSVSLDTVKKKWNQKAFAAGVDRKQIEMCEAKLGIKLDEFIEIALGAMQNISTELGL